METAKRIPPYPPKIETGIQGFDKLSLGGLPRSRISLLKGGPGSGEDVAKQMVQHGAQDYILDSRLDSYSLSKALHNMLERTANAEALFIEKERAEVTLNSIGDAVISTDVAGNVTYLNQVAEAMTGWTSAEALGEPFSEVFRIIDSTNPEHTVNPMAIAIQQNRSVGLNGSCVLIRRDGVEFAIEDSAAPIHDRRGQVTGAVMVFHDVTEARALSQRMSYLAHHDYLTDLPNRLLLDDRLIQAMAAARRRRQQLAVLFVDVDRFKHINDSLGHAIGDELLQSVGGRLVASVRGSDTVSRQGGDEFVVLLSSIAHAEDAALSANKILAALPTVPPEARQNVAREHPFPSIYSLSDLGSQQLHTVRRPFCAISRFGKF
jgi:diguanylate cyclase (GGDEF)-like protein/PAS domain S-box-containing protein